MKTQSERYVARLKQVVALRKAYAESQDKLKQRTQRAVALSGEIRRLQDCNKELNTEYQLLHQELEATKQQVYNKMDKIEHLELINTELQTQLDNALNKMTASQQREGKWKLLFGVMEDLYEYTKQELEVANIILDLRR